MQLIDQLLNDDEFSDQEEQTPPANNASNSNQATGASALSGELNVNGRRNRSDSESEAEEAARLERRTVMEAFMDEYNIHGSSRQLGHRFADVSPHVSHPTYGR
ncbi:hypothetical protein FRC08_003025 [Ceratobasidium sp. 394]|nr:hypothetical protein FRC08_003025 [Ceratobasidium sp. 394]KAG9081716.1 hypothetical protein FS749_007446 [Ceratobasidium sp. UAMH 11750]